MTSQTPSFTPLANLDAFWRVLARRFGQSRFRTVLLVFSGLAVALPLMFLLGTQLSSADAAFEFLRSRFTAPFWRYGGKLLLGLIAASARLHVPLRRVLWVPTQAWTEIAVKPDDARIHIVPSEAVIAALVPICLLQAFYLASQVAYSLSNFSGFLPENYTYAEYARRGF